MELFANIYESEKLEQQLAESRGHARLPILIALAWQLRQSDTENAIELSNEAEQLINDVLQFGGDTSAMKARLYLIRGEAMLLYGDRLTAQELVNSARQLFESTQDNLGSGDCCWLDASLSLDCGDYPKLDADLLRAVHYYTQGGDSLRAHMASVRKLYYAASSEPEMARDYVQNNELFQPASESHPALATWIESLRACLAPRGSEVILHWQFVYELALKSGQLRQAILATMNMAEQFVDIHDANSALDIAGRGLDLARRANWPSVVGICLLQMGDVFRSLGRFQDAQEFIEEALPKFSTGSQASANGLLNLGKVAMEMSDCELALQRFIEAEHCFDQILSFEGRIRSHLGQAQALLQLGYFDKAYQMIGIVQAEADRYEMSDVSVEILRLLANLSRFTGHPDDQSKDRLNYLLKALAKAKSIDNFMVPDSLLEDIAGEYASNEDYFKAYHFALEAGKARMRLHRLDKSLRAISLNMQKETEKLMIDSKHHKLLMESEAKRADELSSANSILELLGTIGQEITASLSSDAVFNALDQHLHSLLDAFSIVIYQMNPAQTELQLAFGVEENRSIPFHRIAVDDAESKIAFCARERQMLMLSIKDPVVHVLPRTVMPLSRMYSPLMVGEMLLGVLSIQSLKPYAYGKREQLIFRTLCAYSAIALSNCSALSALHQAQTELIQKNLEFEKLAMVDGLTGLFNRRYIDWSMKQQIAIGQRYRTPFSVILLDIDLFKLVNDTFGHQSGDVVLCHVADIINKRSRESDIPGRWGGEEFMIICPNCNLDGAKMFAEILRRLIELYAFPGVGSCTASFGVAEFIQGDTESSILIRVDKSLYAAKSQGRNQVVAL